MFLHPRHCEEPINELIPVYHTPRGLSGSAILQPLHANKFEEERGDPGETYESQGRKICRHEACHPTGPNVA